MYFITNRQPKPNSTDFEFDLHNNAPSNQLYCCKRIVSQGVNGEISRYQEIGHKMLMNAMKTENCQHILWYIHGFNQLPEKNIFQDALHLQQRLGTQMLVIPIIWPCDNDLGLARDYWDDQRAADMSVFAFSRLLYKFFRWQEVAHCRKKMSILAHSMGNRVLRGTLQEFNDRYGVACLFEHIYMVAADLRQDTLHGHGAVIRDFCKDLSIFYNKHDRALTASKLANLRHGFFSRRLGATGIHPDIKGIHEVDCSHMIMSDPLGHNYYLELMPHILAGESNDVISNDILVK